MPLSLHAPVPFPPFPPGAAHRNPLPREECSDIQRPTWDNSGSCGYGLRRTVGLPISGASQALLRQLFVRHLAIFVFVISLLQSPP
jgi:hypothetical protein